MLSEQHNLLPRAHHTSCPICGGEDLPGREDAPEVANLDQGYCSKGSGRSIFGFSRLQAVVHLLLKPRLEVLVRALVASRDGCRKFNLQPSPGLRGNVRGYVFEKPTKHRGLLDAEQRVDGVKFCLVVDDRRAREQEKVRTAGTERGHSLGSERVLVLCEVDLVADNELRLDARQIVLAFHE